MKALSTVFVFLFLCVSASACLTEEDMATKLQAAFADVQVQGRFEGLHAEQFMNLFAQTVNAEEPPPIDVVVVYSKPEMQTHKLVFYTGGCMIGHGYVLTGTYAEILLKLKLAMAI